MKSWSVGLIEEVELVVEEVGVLIDVFETVSL